MLRSHLSESIRAILHALGLLLSLNPTGSMKAGPIDNSHGCTWPRNVVLIEGDNLGRLYARLESAG